MRWALLLANVTLDTLRPQGFATIPTYLYSFRLDRGEALAFGFGAVPEPSTWAMMVGGFGLVGGAIRRRQRRMKIVTN